jgi:small redox-active disulfide protein 2
MIVKILGSGCPKCKQLEKNLREALKLAGIDAQIEKVKNLNEIMKYNVFMVPTLVIDGEVKSVGKVLSIEQIKKLIGEKKGC